MYPSMAYPDNTYSALRVSSTHASGQPAGCDWQLHWRLRALQAQGAGHRQAGCALPEKQASQAGDLAKGGDEVSKCARLPSTPACKWCQLILEVMRCRSHSDPLVKIELAAATPETPFTQYLRAYSRYVEECNRTSDR